MTNHEPGAAQPDWPDIKDFRRSVRRDAAIYVAAIIFILMAVTGYVVQREYVATVTRGVLEKLQVQALAFSSTSNKLYVSAGGPDVLLLSNTCNRIKADNPAVHWAGFTGTDGRWIAHSDIRRVASGDQYRIIKPIDVPVVNQTGEQFEQRGDDTLVIATTIAERGVSVGTLVIASSTSMIKSARLASIRTVLIITISMMLLGIPATTIAVRRLLQPVATISKHLRQVSPESPSWAIPVTGRNEFGFLAATLGALGTRLNDARKELVEKERLSKELEIAREIQLSILPRTVPKDDRFACGVAYRSAREVGGDYYDFLSLDDRHLGILVADVSGKSLPGMLVMLMTRDIVRSVAMRSSEPAEILALVNAELQPNMRRGTFVTMFLGVLDRETGILEYASAGHNPLIIMRHGGNAAELEKPKGYPLGMMTDAVFRSRIESARLLLTPGDWVVQYTDGVNEGQNAQREEFGMNRFVECVRSAAHSTSDEFVKSVIAAHTQFVGTAQQYDDITLMALHWGQQVVQTMEPMMEGVADAN